MSPETPPRASTRAAALRGPGAQLRLRAEEAASPLPPLLVQAEQLAGAVLLGEHGRRRSGVGDDFWQYRPVQPGDSRRSIDHRRSARGDQQFVREREWQIAQTVQFWTDCGTSMRFASREDLPTKGARARLLALATAILMVRGGERVGLTGGLLPPRRGKIQILRMAETWTEEQDTPYAPPEHRALVPHARALFISDFLGPMEELETALTKSADRGVRGILLQVLDPSEEAFPFAGRTRFESVTGALAHETLKARALRDRYLDRLADRRDAMDHLCRQTGWQLGLHHTDQSAQAGLLWLHGALGRSAVQSS